MGVATNLRSERIRDKEKAQDQLRLELMHARTDLAFLLSDQVQTDADQIRNVRLYVSQLLEAIKYGEHNSLFALRSRTPI